MASLLSIAWITVIAFGGLFYAGFGITRLLAFGAMRQVEVLLAPFLGFSLICIVGHWCGWLGWSAGIAARSTLVLATFFSLLAVVQRRGKGLKVLEHLPIFALACLTFTVAIYPLWWSNTLGPIGADGKQVFYTHLASQIDRGGLLGSIEAKLFPDQHLKAGEAVVPLGFSYLHSFIDKLSRHETHETFALVTALTLALGVLSYASLAVCLLRAGRLGVFLTALLTAISPLLLWGHYASDAQQVIGLSLVPLAFGMSVLGLEQGRRYLVLPALLLAAALMTHPWAAMALALGAVVVYIALRAVSERRQLAYELRALALLLVLAGLLAFPGLLYAGSSLWHRLDLDMVGQFAGGGLTAPWRELYGLSQHHLPEDTNPLGFLQASSLLGAIGALAITLYGVWTTTGVGRTAMLALGLVYVASLIWFRYVLASPEAFFVMLMFATFPAFAGFGLGCERLLTPSRNLGRRTIVVVVTLLIFLVGTNITYLFALSRWTTTMALDFPSLLALREVQEHLRHGERIHIRDATNTPLLWMAFFLKDYELSHANRVPSPRQESSFNQPAIRADFVLADKATPLAEPWARTTIYENKRYKILQKEPGILVHLDFRRGLSMLMPGQELRLDIRPERLGVDDQIFSLTPALAGMPARLRLGMFAPSGAAIDLHLAGRREVLRADDDLYTLEVPLEQFPLALTIENVGTRGIPLLGWLELVDGQGRDSNALPREALFGYLPEEVLPGSGVFVADGWHGLEEGRKRWTTGVAFGIFRNPLKPLALQLEGFLPFPPQGTSPVVARVLVNGHLLGELREPGNFAQRYAVPLEILGTSKGGELKLSLDRSINLQSLGLSEDGRELGMLVRHVDLLDIELPPDGFIDIGTRGARRYLVRGWANDELLEGSSFAWATTQESLVQIAFPESRDFRVEMRGFPFRYPSAPPQEIGIYVNGWHLQDVLLEGGPWQIYSFKLPRAFVVAGINTFRFVYRYAVAPPAIIPGNTDHRMLAVAFDFIMFRPE
jgi:hypothetical protein